MKKKNIYVLIVVLYLVSCTKELRFNPPFEGEKLVLNGYISTSETIINITHSVNPVRNYLPEEKLSISDASVVLLENDLPVVQLEHSENGVYLIPESSSFKPTVGDSYSIQAFSEKYGEVKSDNIILPAIPEINVLSFEQFGINNNSHNGLLSLSIPELSINAIYIYLSALSSSGNMLFIYKYPINDANLYFANCEATVGNTLIYDNSCGFSNTVQKFIIPLQSSLNEPFYESINIKIGVVSRELFDYAISYNEIYGLEYGFTEPPVLKSNMHGGYGLFYALNTFEHVVNQLKMNK